MRGAIPWRPSPINIGDGRWTKGCGELMMDGDGQVMDGLMDTPAAMASTVFRRQSPGRLAEPLERGARSTYRARRKE
jgi:hypothetical protein